MQCFKSAHSRFTAYPSSLIRNYLAHVPPDTHVDRTETRTLSSNPVFIHNFDTVSYIAQPHKIFRISFISVRTVILREAEIRRNVIYFLILFCISVLNE